MSEYLMLSLYDEKLKTYSHPVYMRDENSIFKAISVCLQAPEHPVTISPDEYQVVSVGSFDDTTGQVKLCRVSYGTVQSLIEKGTVENVESLTIDG